MSMSALFGGAVPVGTVLDYPAGATPPAGWLRCEGQVLTQTANATLFTALGHRPQLLSSVTSSISNPSNSLAISNMFESNGRLIARRSNNTGQPDEWAYSTDGGVTFTTFGVTGAAAGVVDKSAMSWNGTRSVFVRPNATNTNLMEVFHSADGSTWTAGATFTSSIGTPNVTSIAGLGHIFTHAGIGGAWGTASDPPATVASLATSLPTVTPASGTGRGYACAISGVGFLLCDNDGNIRFHANGGAAGQTPTGVPAVTSNVRVWSLGTTFVATSSTGLVSTSATGTAFTDRSTASRGAGLVHATNIPQAVYDGTYVFVGDGNALVKAAAADLATWTNVVAVGSIASTAAGATARQNLARFGTGQLIDSDSSSITVTGVALPNTLNIVGMPSTGRLMMIGTSGTSHSNAWVSFDGGVNWGLSDARDFALGVAPSILPGTYSNDAFMMVGASGSNIGLRRTTMPYTQATQFQIPNLRSPMQGMGKIIKVT